MKYFFLIIFGFFIVSCSNFYEFSSRTEEKEMFRTFKMPVAKDSLEFNAYNDYYFDTINLDVVYITTKELKKLKKETVSSKNKQILFLHNDTPFYLNVIGYYYPNVCLNEIQKPQFEFSTISLEKGLGYEFNFNEKQVADFYVPYKEGILRFLAIGNPEWMVRNPDRFQMEIDFLFYGINSNYFKLK